MSNPIYSIFKNGSKTYFYSSLFFTGQTKSDVFKLYGFVRKADDYVDTIPQQIEEFYNFKNLYHRALKGYVTGNIVIDSFVELMHRKQFHEDWIDAFLYSMESDITKQVYHTIDELKTYLYGSAEVVGLMMAHILDLPSESHNAARYLGRSMQYINFIRDIQEDLELSRTYLPYEEMEQYDLTSLDYDHVIQHPQAFEDFIAKQVQRYHEWQTGAEQGFHFIPKKFRIPIKTASEMYKWTAHQILENPYKIYREKIKPSIIKIILNAAYNTIAVNALSN
jgi:phytoene synthase